MKSKNKPSYKELQERLINAEAALETLRSEQIDSNKENRKTLQPSPAQHKLSLTDLTSNKLFLACTISVN